METTYTDRRTNTRQKRRKANNTLFTRNVDNVCHELHAVAMGISGEYKSKLPKMFVAQEIADMQQAYIKQLEKKSKDIIGEAKETNNLAQVNFIIESVKKQKGTEPPVENQLLERDKIKAFLDSLSKSEKLQEYKSFMNSGDGGKYKNEDNFRLLLSDLRKNGFDEEANRISAADRESFFISQPWKKDPEFDILDEDGYFIGMLENGMYDRNSNLNNDFRIYANPNYKNVDVRTIADYFPEKETHMRKMAEQKV